MSNNITVTNNQSIKADGGKYEPILVPPAIIKDVAEIRNYGLRKYGNAEAYKEVEISRWINALYRHLLAMVENGYDSKDEESGLEHYKHLACNAAFICDYMERKRNGNRE